MKISLNWLKEYIDLEESPGEIADILTSTGLEVEKIEEFQSIKGDISSLVTGKILECYKHPNADNLKITLVDVGEEKLQIVCGAPNVAVGQTGVVARVGTLLTPVSGEPFKIQKSKIRGELSMGMLCAEDEIGLGDDHNGIIVLEGDHLPGTSVESVLNVYKDTIFEIGLTPNRGDATSHYGVARDLRAVLKRPIKLPSLSNFSVDNKSGTVEVLIKNKEACPRYSGITISGITVEESPEWLRNRLNAIGLHPINNIVDITNFVLHELGQPLHAFDADKIKGDKVIIDVLPRGTVFKTLDGVERKLQETDLMICNEKEGMCMAGVFGGLESGVTEKTKNIFLESAFFSPDFIRKTAQHHQLRTDASFRFERGTDPNMTVTALKRAALMIKEIAGGTISSEIVDIYPNIIEDRKIAMKCDHIDRLIGKVIDRDEIFSILKGLDIKVENKVENGFTVMVPPYRNDVTREADVIEEILRIYGFNNVEIPENVGAGYMAEFPEIDVDKYQGKITDMLTASGFYEVMTNSLTKPAYTDLDGNASEEESVVILNRLSEDLGVMRQNMMFSLLEVASYNRSHKQSNLKLFEFGKIYKKEKGRYSEKKQLGILITGNFVMGDWSHEEKPSSIHHIADVIGKIVSRVSLEDIRPTPYEDSTFDYAAKYQYRERSLARIGKIRNTICKAFEIKNEVFFGVIDWGELMKIANPGLTYQEVPKFPEVKRDLSLVLDNTIEFNRVYEVAVKNSGQLLRKLNVFDVYSGNKIESGKKAYAITFILQDKEKTLTDKIIDKTMERLMSSFEKELGAIIRK